MNDEPKSFGKVYAQHYDAIYEDKDYDAECDFIEKIFNLHKADVKHILDVGCGTGGHLIPLTTRGYQVTGIDSSTYMLNVLQKKINPKMQVEIHQSRIQDLELDSKFDAIISMFSVLNYITDTSELLHTLKLIHRYLEPGGLFIFDIWYGPAVTWIRPDPKIKIVMDGDTLVHRMAAPTLDLFNHTVKVYYSLLTVQKTENLEDVSETHIMRYFFPQEIIYFLQIAGFEVLNFCEFMDLDKLPSIETWNTLIVARRK